MSLAEFKAQQQVEPEPFLKAPQPQRSAKTARAKLENKLNPLSPALRLADTLWASGGAGHCACRCVAAENRSQALPGGRKELGANAQRPTPNAQRPTNKFNRGKP